MTAKTFIFSSLDCPPACGGGSPGACFLRPLLGGGTGGLLFLYDHSAGNHSNLNGGNPGR